MADMKIELIIKQEGRMSRFAHGDLLVNGEHFPAASIDFHMDRESEYLLIRVPLFRVEIRSDPSELKISQEDAETGPNFLTGEAKSLDNGG